MIWVMRFMIWAIARRYALTDSQWRRIEDLLPGKAAHVAHPASNNRRLVDAVLCRYRAGIPWRDLCPSASLSLA